MVKFIPQKLHNPPHWTKLGPLVSLGLLASLFLAACVSTGPVANVPPIGIEITPTPQTTGPGRGGVLRLLNPEAPTLLNPHLASALKDREASRITYEPLASFNKEGVLVPFLAAEIPSLENGGVAADGKSVTWKLRQDVKWSDGQAFSAEDVIFTYQFATNPEVKASTAAVYSVIESVEIVDSYTIKINFKDVNPAWASPFVGFYGMILPRHVFEAYNGPNAREAPANNLPVGSGPYRVMAPGIKPQEVLLLGTQLVETNKIVFEPNPYFREADKPFFSRVEMRGGGTANEAARLVFQADQMDYAYDLGQLSPETIAAFDAAGRGRLITDFGARVERLLINRTDPNRETADGERSSLQFPHPFLSDKRVRQAFAYAIDHQAIAALYEPGGKPTNNNLVAPPQYNSPNVFYTFDPDKAKALLDEAGWVDTNRDGIRDKDGVKLKVVYQASVSPIVQKVQHSVKAMLEAIGVEVVLKIVDSGTMFSAGASNPDTSPRFNADIQQFSARSPNPDPNAYMRYWACDRIPQKANNWAVVLNFERWCNPDYDALLQQVAVEMNPERRAQLFIQMNDMLIEDVVMIPLAHLADVRGVGRDIEGVDLTPWDMNTWNIKDWRRVSP